MSARSGAGVVVDTQATLPPVNVSRIVAPRVPVDVTDPPNDSARRCRCQPEEYLIAALFSWMV